MRAVLRPSFLLPLTLLSLMLGCAMPLDQMSPLHAAAYQGDLNKVNQLVANGADVNARHGDYTVVIGYAENSGSRVRNKTALMFAAERGHLAVVKSLVDANADIYVIEEDASGHQRGNAFDLSVEEGHTAIARFLWERSDRIRFTAKLDQQLAWACSRFCSERFGNDPTTNLALFVASIIPNQQQLGEGIGKTACRNPHALNNLRFLLGRGVQFPENTLHCVAVSDPEYLAKQSLEAARFLLDHGASPNAPSKGSYSATPLMLAALKHNPEMVELFLGRGGDPNFGTDAGGSPLASAAAICHYGSGNERARQLQLRVMQQLVAAGAKPQPQSRNRGIPGAELINRCCTQKDVTEDQLQICRLLTGSGGS